MQRVLAWVGLILMVACFVWVQVLPSPPRVSDTIERSRGDRSAVNLVVIDAGHGGQDSGTMRDGVAEKDLTLDVALKLEQLMRGRGLRTMLTRRGDEYVSLANRAAAANQESSCVFVSIHFDDGTRAAASGVNTYYAMHQRSTAPLLPTWLAVMQPISSEPMNLDSQSLAGFVQQALVARTQAVDRGTRSEQFYVIANVRHPAVLVEGGFLTNNDDMGKLRTEEYRQQLATAISEGIMRYREIAHDRAIAVMDEPPRA
jgi:N-acetylmuramoyl-L-alanine amidase